MRKNFLYRGMMLLAGITAMASCTNEDDIAQGGTRNALDVNVAVQDVAGSRAMVFGQYLAANSEIGVSVVADADGGNYDGITTGYTNVAYRATGESTSQTWAASDASKQILLSGTAGKAIAYYPYASTVTDYTAIPVDIADQTDWMYSGEVGPLNDAAPSAEFVMQHALTALNVNFVRDAAYTGAGEVTALTVTSDGLATNGTFSAVDGVFASTSGAGSAVSVIDAAFTLTSGAANQENPYMFVPASNETKDFTVTATVDGKAYNVGVAMTEAFASGKMYQLNVKVTNTGLTVSKVTLVDWNIDTTLPDAEFEPDLALTWDNLENGVYAVSAEGNPVLAKDADPTCKAVAIIDDNAPVPQRFMIEKNDYRNAAYPSGCEGWVHWLKEPIDLTEIDNCSYYGGESFNLNISSDYAEWPIVDALMDFNGKEATSYISNYSSDEKDMCIILQKFNADATQNQGYNDWYIPACGQLGVIAVHVDEVDAVLQAIGGMLMPQMGTLSTTEYGTNDFYGVNFRRDSGNSVIYGLYTKNATTRLRFIRDIQ